MAAGTPVSQPILVREITIREATIKDLEAIVSHRLGMFRDMGSDAAVLEKIAKNSRPYIERGLRDGWYHGWLAMAKNEVAAGAGVIVYDWPTGPLDPDQNKRAYFLNVYTEPKFRRMGLARKLTEIAMDWARVAGFNVLWLHASEQGRPVYEKVGFEQTNEMKIKL